VLLSWSINSAFYETLRLITVSTRARHWSLPWARWIQSTSHHSLIDWLRWSETVSQNCGHQRAYLSSPGRYVSIESHGVMMPAGDNSWLIHQSSLAVLPAETSGAGRRKGRRSENFAYRYLKYLKESFTCRKILRHWTSGFTSHPKEDVLWIFIAIKNPLPRPGLNPRPLGPVVSTLTTTPPRRLHHTLHLKDQS
jgi:hypothetical protein